jgi:TPR repeat protein
MSEAKNVGLTLEQAYEFTHLLTAAKEGSGAAACILGDMYREGRGGLRHSPRRTFIWYARSALAGDPDGQNNLGVCYEAGFGCRQDYRLALKWYGRAAAQKSSVGTYNTGLCYLNGRGVPASRVEALVWFRNALSLGHEPARDKLRECGADADFETEEENA